MESGNWNGSSITVMIEELTPGNYTYICKVYDQSGNSISDTVLVVIPVKTSRADWPPLIISSSAIIILILFKRKKSL